MQAMSAIAEVGGIAGVTPAEHTLVTFLTQRAIERGAKAPIDFARSRPPVSESAGVALACEAAIATGCRLHLRQISCLQSVDVIRHYKSRSDGLISAETLPHNLFLNEADLLRLGPTAKMSPPLRDSKHADALWEGLKDGTIDIVVTDHAPHLLSEKAKGADNIWDAPSGIPGLETLLPAMLERWREGDISLPQIVRWLAHAPAELFGLAKGHLSPGADADFLILDPRKPGVISAEKMFTKGKYTPFDGRATAATITQVFLRGKTIFHNGGLAGPPCGRFIRPMR
ncbi:dihydroorotase [Pseudorhodoplanes sp.]|uniref:dihydroorotase n=1 Tax=Pseudorhodoplanes sp. TaxID=1934341 RepID=UPI003D0FF54E